MYFLKVENTKPLLQETTNWPNLVCPKLKKYTSTETESVENATPTPSHDSTQHIMMNMLHVEARDTGQDSAEKQNTKQTL